MNAFKRPLLGPVVHKRPEKAYSEGEGKSGPVVEWLVSFAEIRSFSGQDPVSP